MEACAVSTGRRGGGFGPSAALYDPAFSYAVDALAHLDAVKPEQASRENPAAFDIFTRLVSLTHLVNMKHKSESEYSAVLTTELKLLFDEPNLEAKVRQYDQDGRLVTEVDGEARCPTVYDKTAVYIAIEKKLTSGNGGQDDVQAFFTYRRQIASGEVRRLGFHPSR